MMFCFKNILQIWIILIGFRDTNDFVNPGICKHEFKFTCHGYCRFTLKLLIPSLILSYKENVYVFHFSPISRKFLKTAEIMTAFELPVKSQNKGNVTLS